MAFYTYDADGRLATYSEPNAISSWNRTGNLDTTGPITAVKKYDYGYYADGLLSQVATEDGSYSQQYAYRNDGLLEAQTSSAAWNQSGTPMHDSFTWNQAFTAAGRLMTKTDGFSDPCPANEACSVVMDDQLHPALSVNYDVYGRYKTWTLRAGAYGNFSYDLEGEPTSFTTTPTLQQTSPPWTLRYSTRGELLSENDPFAQQPVLNYRSADGFMYSMNTVDYTDKYGDDQSVVPALTFDTRASAIIASTIPHSVPVQTTTYSYDLAGRRLVRGRQYDALNRIRQGTFSYSYGPGTIPVTISGSTEHAPLGVTPVMSTDGSGNVEDIKFGMNSEIVPMAKFSGLMVYDRDPFGYVAVQRNSTGNSGFAGPAFGCSGASTGVSATTGFVSSNGCGSTAQLYAYRTDGYFDGSLTFRGVRTYDGDTQQWSHLTLLPGTRPIRSVLSLITMQITIQLYSRTRVGLMASRPARRRVSPRLPTRIDNVRR